MRTRTLMLVAGLLALSATAFAGSASAASLRQYVTQLHLKQPEAVTTLPSGNIVVSEVGASTVTEYTPYPDLEKVRERPAVGQWGGSTQVHSMDESSANNFFYVATDGEELKSGGSCGGTPFTIFDNFGGIRLSEREGGGFDCEAAVAVDNDPQSDNYGHYYYYAHSVIVAFDGYGNPAPFTATGGNISGNEITGTPFGSFESNGSNPEIQSITVDEEGNLWLTDQGKREILEFAPSGAFIQRINETSAEVPALPGRIESHPFGYYPGLTGIDIDPQNGDVATSDKSAGVIPEFTAQGKYLGYTDGSETPQGEFGFYCGEGERFCYTHTMGVAFDQNGYMYIADGFGNNLDIFAPLPKRPKAEYKPDTNPTATGATLNAVVDANGGGPITSCKFDFGQNVNYTSATVPCSPSPVGSGDSSEVHADVSGLTTETTYHYRVEVANANGTYIGKDRTITPHGVLGLRAEAPTAVSAEGATLNGSFIGNGAHTTYWFEYGPTTAYGTKVPLPAPPGADAGSPAGPGRTSLEVDLSGLKPVTRYHYRVVAENGSSSVSDDLSFRTAPLLPEIVRQNVTEVHSNQLQLNGEVNPGGADTTYSFEYGKEDCAQVPDPCSDPFQTIHIGSDLTFQPGSTHLEGLEPGTTYYYRMIATNSQGTRYGKVRTFTTYRFSTELEDQCPNVLSRQQTGAAFVTDCRSYELVSAAHAGGYDVESDLVPGQNPFDGYPRVGNPPKVLYGIDSGAIPGVAGNPTNKGIDPYVATRGENGWTTAYVGISANVNDKTAPFASTLAEADPSLDSFAFGGPELCSPCFPDESTGVPIRGTDGQLIQGMKGSIPQPTGTEDGVVRKRFSGDGAHFVFSSTSQFEPAGNASTGDVSIYDRNLTTNSTQVVSTDDEGHPLTCLQGAGACHAPGDGDGISELDISNDGSRIVVGQKIGDDAAGNGHFHLYMHVGTSAESIDLTPGATAGALFDGMTADGSRVFVTTTDKLLSEDTDASADIYEASISGSSAALRLITTDGGSPLNDDSCEPSNTPNTWNSVSGDGKCSPVAFAGGAGIASGNGAFYFVSPEQLDDSKGVANQANLYVVQPGGDPEFVATMDSSIGKAPPPDATHVFSKGAFLSGLKRPESIAVDQNTGDVFVSEAETGEISRWTASGAESEFSALGDNKITGQEFGGGPEGQIAVDSSPGPFSGDLYATTNADTVNVFDETGEQIGELTGLVEACGVAVDQSNGDVYVGSYSNLITRFRPQSGTQPVSNGDYQVTGVEVEDGGHCNIGVSSEGHVYGWGYTGGQIHQYKTNRFGPKPYEALGTGTTKFGTGVNVQADPTNGDVYVDTGGDVARYSSAGALIERFGSGHLTESHGIGVGPGGIVYATNVDGTVTEFGLGEVPYTPIDNPAIVHGVQQPDVHHWADFQVTPSGRFSAFATSQPLDQAFENLEHAEVYRYDTIDSRLDCVSCSPTNALATSDAALATNGLSLVDDGRVFFNTGDGIVLRDGDRTQDIYEWEEPGIGPANGGCDNSNPNQFPGGVCLSLISSGTSQFDSSLLGATADGTDALFFTHDSLAPEDENGPVTKLYDARVNGGLFSIPPPALCAASDECHGPGTTAAAPIQSRTTAGTPGNTKSGGTKKSAGCKKGFVKKHGKCVRKKKSKKAKKKRDHRGRRQGA